MVGEDHLDSPLLPRDTPVAILKGSLKPVDQFKKVDRSRQPDEHSPESQATERKARELDDAHEKAVAEATRY